MELGVIAFVGSFVMAMWVFGLRDKFDGEQTASAYSVFNKGGKSLPGSLTAQDVDQQLRAGGFANNPDSASTKDQGVPTGPAEPKTMVGLESKGFTLNQNQEERVRRRRAAADAALKRRISVES